MSVKNVDLRQFSSQAGGLCYGSWTSSKDAAFKLFYLQSFKKLLIIPKLSDFFKDVIFLLELACFPEKIACSNLSGKMKNN